MRPRTPFALAAALAALPAAAQTTGFTPGEELRYEVEYLGVRTAEARIVVGRPEGVVWPVICQARTGGVARFLDIREHYVSYWDAEALLPRGSDLAAVELGDRHFDTARFDRERGKVTFAVQRPGRRQEGVYDVPPDAHDVGSALLALRVRRLVPGGRVEIPVFTSKRTFTMVADVLGRERVETEAGHFDALKVQVRTAFDGKFEAKRDTFIWFTDDLRQVPVMLSADFAVGSMVVSLVSYRAGAELARR